VFQKNFENLSTFAKGIIKHQVAYFFGTRCSYNGGPLESHTWSIDTRRFQ